MGSASRASQKRERTLTTPPPRHLATPASPALVGDDAITPPRPETKRPRRGTAMLADDLLQLQGAGGVDHPSASMGSSSLPARHDAYEKARADSEGEGDDEQHEVRDETAEARERKLLEHGDGLSGDALKQFLNDQFLVGLDDVDQLLAKWS